MCAAAITIQIMKRTIYPFRLKDYPVVKADSYFAQPHKRKQSIVEAFPQQLAYSVLFPNLPP